MDVAVWQCVHVEDCDVGSWRSAAYGSGARQCISPVVPEAGARLERQSRSPGMLRTPIQIKGRIYYYGNTRLRLLPPEARHNSWRTGAWNVGRVPRGSHCLGSSACCRCSWALVVTPSLVPYKYHMFTSWQSQAPTIHGEICSNALVHMTTSKISHFRYLENLEILCSVPNFSSFNSFVQYI